MCTLMTTSGGASPWSFALLMFLGSLTLTSSLHQLSCVETASTPLILSQQGPMRSLFSRNNSMHDWLVPKTRLNERPERSAGRAPNSAE